MNEAVTKSEDNIKLFNIMKISTAYEDLPKGLALWRL